jgi:hypothetical protein
MMQMTRIVILAAALAAAASPAEAQKHPLEYPMRVARTTLACPSTVIDEQKCYIMKPSQKLFRRTNTMELRGRCRIIPWRDSTESDAEPKDDAWVDCTALEHTTAEGARAASEFARREREDVSRMERFYRCITVLPLHNGSTAA